MAGFQTPLHTTSPCRIGAAGARIANELPVGIDHPHGNHIQGRGARWSYLITRNERWVAPGVSSVRMCSRWIGSEPR